MNGSVLAVLGAFVLPALLAYYATASRYQPAPDPNGYDQ